MIICISFLFSSAHTSVSSNAPEQDADGYYLLDSKEDFEWFISACEEDTKMNVRLTKDLILNDTSHWTDWTDTHPENGFGAILQYDGHLRATGSPLKGTIPPVQRSGRRPFF